MKTTEFCRLIQSVGFNFIRSNDHLIYGNGQRHIAIPHQRQINRMMARRLLKEIGYSQSVPELNYVGK